MVNRLRCLIRTRLAPARRVTKESKNLPAEADLADRIRGLLSPSVDEAYLKQYAGYAKKAQKETFGIEDEICVLDVETTGISPMHERIIEIAILKMSGPKIIDEFSTYVNPGKPISREITELTGISDADVADAPFIDEVAPQIHAFIGERDILAHNAAFDKSFIEAALKHSDVAVEYGPLRGSWLDSLVFLRAGLPLLRSFKLEDLMRAYCPEEYAQAHRAIADVRGLCQMWRIALVGLSSLEPSVLRALPSILSNRPERKWIAQVSALYAGSGAGQPRLKTLRQQKIKSQSPEEMLDARTKMALTTVLEEQIADDLSEFGLAGKMYESFESRPEQIEMAFGIGKAFEERRHLVVEAGTGVGKSLAYLVCLARLALKNNINVGVATKTNALTDQLMGKELPLLAEALAQESTAANRADCSVPDDSAAEGSAGSGSKNGDSTNTALQPALRYAALKGYSHYLCLRRLSSLLAEESPYYALALAQMLAWISQTAWGELSSVNLPLNYRDRQTFAASSADCLRRSCSYYFQCYVQGARRIAKSSHIVVTNHSLLFRNSAADGKILPPIRYWAVDEAHNLESEARKQLARSFDERELDATIKQISGSRGLPKRLIAAASKYMPTASKGEIEKLSELADELADELKQLNILAENFFAYARDLEDHGSHSTSYGQNSVRGGDGAGTGRTAAQTYWIGPELREASAWGSLCSVGFSLSSQIQSVIEAGKKLTSSYSWQLDGDYPPSELSDLAGLMSILDAMAETLACVINEPEENLVYALCLSREYQGRRSASIEVAQLEVGEKIANELLEKADSLIFTSATLAVGDSFSRFARGIGLDLPSGERSFGEKFPSNEHSLEEVATWSSLQLASSYDLPNLMRILVPSDLPEPRSRDWMQQLKEFLNQVHLRSNGGVLTLFTSRKDLMDCRDYLQDELRGENIDVLAQDGMLSARVLQERFIADPQASLLATKSFWEGFDASGDTLRCIVIPKLPFGRPDTPLSRERKLVYGRGAWARYDLPEAILELKQAVGRLVRTSTDSGIVILADTRVLSKGYGKRVLDALPVKAESLPMSELLDQI